MCSCSTLTNRWEHFHLCLSCLLFMQQCHHRWGNYNVFFKKGSSLVRRQKTRTSWMLQHRIKPASEVKANIPDYAEGLRYFEIQHCADIHTWRTSCCCDLVSKPFKISSRFLVGVLHYASNVSYRSRQLDFMFSSVCSECSKSVRSFLNLASLSLACL